MEKFGVIKKKSLLFYMVAGLGGVWSKVVGAGTPIPSGAVEGQLCFSILVCEGSRIILCCSPALDVKGLGSWGLCSSQSKCLALGRGTPRAPY